MKTQYLVVYECGTTNLSGFVPDLPGYVSTGKSLDEIRRNLTKAMELHLQGLIGDGNPMPNNLTRVVQVPQEGMAEWLEVEVQDQFRRSAKSTHPDFEAAKVYLKKSTKLNAWRKWEDAGGGDFSDLVQHLLEQYLAS